MRRKINKFNSNSVSQSACATGHNIYKANVKLIVVSICVCIYSGITWMDDTGVTLVDCIAAARHSVANLSTLEGTLTADNVVLTAASAHNAPLWTWTVVVQVPVI